jgi:hypothetical protein
MAEGGDISFITVDEDTYEVHVFSTVGPHTLSFEEPVQEGSITADVLVVGGGGGSGGNSGADKGGGGGAGGLLYQTGQNLTLTDGSVTVTVGDGGAGGAKKERGADGGLSSIGEITVPGGGGGGRGYSDAASDSDANGGNGGSGGGGGALNNSNSGTAGTAVGDSVLGNNGGRAGGNSGGGGGGATGTGGNVTADYAGTGGAGWKPSDNEAEWIELVTDTEEFSHGGRGGSNKGEPEGPSVNYGDGGSGSNGNTAGGKAGHSGIVVIRFLHNGT